MHYLFIDCNYNKEINFYINFNLIFFKKIDFSFEFLHVVVLYKLIKCFPFPFCGYQIFFMIYYEFSLACK
jgi:hypothetical protein